MIKAIYSEGTFFLVPSKLYQWDKNKTLQIEGLDFTGCTELHFFNAKTSTALRREIVDGQAGIPDSLLADPYDITVLVCGDDDTIKDFVIPVKTRNKPDDYIYTDEEVKTWETLECAVEELKNEPITTERIENDAVTIDKVDLLFFDKGLKFVKTDDIKTDVTQMYPSKQILITSTLANKVTTITAESTDVQIPTAKAVNDIVENFKTEIQNDLLGGVDLTPYVKLADISESGRKIKIVAGVIRNTGNGWEFIENATHSKLGFSAISEDTASITLTHNFKATKILGFSITPDETFAEQGYIAGASVGVSSTVIRIAAIPKEIGGYVAYDEETSSWNTTNLRGINDATFSGGTLNLTHDSLGNAPQFLGNVTGRDGINASFGSVGATSTQIRFYDNEGKLITTPTNNCRAYVTRSRRTAYVTPSSLVSESGNFWIVGVFEVE